MSKKLLFLPLLLALLSTIQVSAQAKMIVGQKYTIFVEIPAGWLQAPNDQLPFFIKPDQRTVSPNTYLYVYGIDYQINPDIKGWISGNNQAVLNEDKNVKIDTLKLKFSNIVKGTYLTGRYQTLSYQYANGREEALLVIECKNTIVTAVLSVNTHAEFEKLLPAFSAAVRTIKILGTTLNK